jgi:hypothetical protein
MRFKPTTVKDGNKVYKWSEMIYNKYNYQTRFAVTRFKIMIWLEVLSSESECNELFQVWQTYDEGSFIHVPCMPQRGRRSIFEMP